MPCAVFGMRAPGYALWGIWHEGPGSGAGRDLGCSVGALWALRELGCGERIRGLVGVWGAGVGFGVRAEAGRWQAVGRPWAGRRRGRGQAGGTPKVGQVGKHDTCNGRHV